MTATQIETQTETVATLGEFALIQRFFAPVPGPLPPGVAVGLGDDAAVLSIPRTQQLVTSTDTLVEGVHFTADTDPYLLGQKALCVNISDLAAMAAQPRWYLLSLSLPPSTPVAWVDALLSGLNQAAQQPTGTVVLVGGNTSTTAVGALSITITLLGLVGKDRAVTRSGAQVGDHILVTGTIGDAALGWSVQQGGLQELDEESRAALQRRHQLPTPPIELAIALQAAALSRSAIDISDGLIADLRHVCQASRVGAQLFAERVPLSALARSQVAQHGTKLLTRLLTGGEDYELLFTVAATAVAAVMVLAHTAGIPVTDIGLITAGSDLLVTYQGQPMALENGGWDHFSAS
ncbi:MAG: thiamine-phosphate kinase [Magnetococcales bacterium]|nr:thiamine-phosphate kinase [Magnetococcales bacterium]